MHEFEVWAPLVERIAVKVGESVYPMQGPDEHGVWRAKVDAAEYGMDYAFLLDDDTKPYPDPRSAWQPHGVHGASRLYDQHAFAWQDAHWDAPPPASAVIYELHIGTFTPEGTFDGAIGRLDYLVDLGITHIEIMPVAEFPGDHGWGYDGVSLFAVREAYGGPDGLKRLVDACHRKGLAVLLDVVYNHFGPVGNYTGKFGPYTTPKHHTPWGSAINFEDAGSDQVRRFFCDNALMWMRDYHIDGLRLDAVHEFVDRSAIHFLEQLSTEVEALSARVGRRMTVIAESDLNDPRVVTPREANGYGIDAQWSDDFHHALFTLINPKQEKGYYQDFGTMADVVKALKHMFVYDGRYSRYRNRSHGRPVEGLSAHRFVSFIQNHDQVGNRAVGDRLYEVVGRDRARVAAGITLTAPFLPMIFQGEEFAASSPFQYFAHHEEPEMAKAVSKGRRREFAAFGWNEEGIPDPERQETFERSKLRWDEVSQGEHAEMLDWYRRLIHLRRSSSSLNDANALEISFDEERCWLAMRRSKVSVMANLGREALSLPVSEGMELRLASREGVKVEGGKVVLPPDTLAIVSSEKED